MAKMAKRTTPRRPPVDPRSQQLQHEKRVLARRARLHRDVIRMTRQLAYLEEKARGDVFSMIVTIAHKHGFAVTKIEQPAAVNE